jgi:hypothetical protein
MAVQDNIKTAAASLRRAIDDNKREIDALRRQKDENRRNKDADIAKKTSLLTIRVKEMQQAQDSVGKSRVQNEISDIDRQIALIRTEETRDDQHFDDEIKARESLNADLENQARALESQAGMATGLL